MTNSSPTVSHSTLRNQDKPINDKQLANIEWVYLHHPSGRLHRINPTQKRLIEILLEWGWKKSPIKHR